MSVQENMDFLNILTVTDPKMYKVTQKWVNKLAKKESLIEEYRELHRKWPYIDRVMSVAWLTIKLIYNPLVIDNWSLLERLGESLESSSEFYDCIRGALVRRENFRKRDKNEDLYIDAEFNYRDTDMKIGELSIRIGDGLMTVYESGVYVGRLLGFPEIVIRDGEIQVRVGMYSKETVYYLVESRSGLKISREIQKELESNEDYSELSMGLTCRLVVMSPGQGTIKGDNHDKE